MAIPFFGMVWSQLSLCALWFLYVGLSENSVPLHPMVLLIIIPF